MSQQVSLKLIQGMKDEVEKFAKEIQENGFPTNGTNLQTIQKKYEEVFKDNLAIQGVPKSSAKRIAIQTAGYAMESVMSNSIQA